MKDRIVLLLTLTLTLTSTAFAVTASADRTWYLAGEAMTVSVTVDDGLIAYAELCDVNSLVAGTMISLNRNKGIGIVELPADLHSGYYVLSVYTRHSTHVSQQLVAIINPLHKSADDDIQWVLDDRCWAMADGHSANTQHLTPNTFEVDERETEGHIVKARVQNVYGGQTFRGSQICPSLSIIGKQIHYFEGKMVNDSIAVFYTYGIHGRQPLVLSAATYTGVSLPIEVMSPFATLLPKQLPHLVFHYKRSEVEARSLEMQRHQMTMNQGDTPPRGLSEVSKYDDTVFGTKPDLTYNLDEYRQFLTIREVLFEYVNCVRSKKTDGVTQLYVRKEQEHYNNAWPAMVLIDGMPVINIERLLAYDARRIHYINIYGGQYTFGNGVYNGILSLITRSGQLTNYPTEPNTQYLEYDFPANAYAQK